MKIRLNDPSMVAKESNPAFNMTSETRSDDIMNIPEFFKDDELYESNGDEIYEETSGDIEIDGECYDTIVVEGWYPEVSENADFLNVQNNLEGEEELIAEIYVEPQSVEIEYTPDLNEYSNVYNKKQCCYKLPTNLDSDCTNLSWLLNFKLDDVINNRKDDSSEKKAAKLSKETCNYANNASQDKPPLTYTKLIELALKEKGELTVSEIYQWISERYPFFKPHDDKWKNSVRHNLSINPHFRKGAKAPKGAGHLWTVATQYDDLDYVLNKHEKKDDRSDIDKEVAAAAASILLHHPSEFLNPVTVESVASEYELLDVPIAYSY